MSTRPSVYPEWATTLSADGPLGGNNRVEPASGDKITGFPYPMQPPREWFNWLYWMNYKWIEYLDEELISGGSSSFAQDNTTTTGLTFGYKKGAYYNQFTKAITEVSAGTIALTSSSTNWISYRPGTGIVKVVGTFSSGATAGDVPLWKAVTDGSGITSLTDVRSTVDRNIVQFTATDKLLGRSTSGAGDAEEITCTAAGRALLDDATAADQLVTLGAAASGLATASGITSQTGRMIGRTTGGTGALEEITVGSGLSLSSGTLKLAATNLIQTVYSDYSTATNVTTVAGTYPALTGGTLIDSVAITPTSSTSDLEIVATVPVVATASRIRLYAFLIESGGTNVIACHTIRAGDTANGAYLGNSFTLRKRFTAASTSPRTYELYVGYNDAAGFTSCVANSEGGEATITVSEFAG